MVTACSGPRQPAQTPGFAGRHRSKAGDPHLHALLEHRGTSHGGGNAGRDHLSHLVHTPASAPQTPPAHRSTWAPASSPPSPPPEGTALSSSSGLLGPDGHSTPGRALPCAWPPPGLVRGRVTGNDSTNNGAQRRCPPGHPELRGQHLRCPRLTVKATEPPRLSYTRGRPPGTGTSGTTGTPAP